MAQLSIVAAIVIKEGYEEELVPIFYRIVDETRKELGVVSYELHQDQQNPLKYIFLETWKSQSDIDKHNQTSHFKQFLSSIEGKVQSVKIEIIKKIY